MKINIHGKVYKTGLRYFLKQRASQLKIKGCIFYGIDNSVEIIAIGENPELNKFIKYCHHGNKDS
nr:acylphosphatase [Bacteroidota bacterium]